jgi:hypothetical protein
VKPSPGSTVMAAKHVHARRFDDEVVILDLEKGTYFGLDEVGARAWESLSEGLTLAQVARRLAAEYETPEEVVLGDISELAARLAEAGLASISEESSK